MSTTSAYLFEAALGVPAAMLLNIQLRYDMQVAKSDPALALRLDSIRKAVASR
jgi:plasmid maintenance system antidote protein VapI